MRGQALFKCWLSYLVRTALGAVVLTLASAVLIDGAGAQTLAAVGDRGDHQTPDHCQGSTYLVGFAVRTGDWVNAMGVICSPVDGNGHTTTPVFGPLRGGNGGSPPHNVTCAVDYIAVGLQIDLTDDKRRVRHVTLLCMFVRTQTQVMMQFGNTNNPHQTAPIKLTCNSGNAIVQVQLNWGADINGVGVTCGPGPKLGSTPPPPPPTTACWTTPKAGMVPGQVVGLSCCNELLRISAKSPPSQVANGSNDAPNWEAAVVCLINAERQSRNLPALGTRGLAGRLHVSALAHAQAAVAIKWWHGPGKFDPHTNPQTGSTIASRIQAAGYCTSSSSARTGEVTFNAWGANGDDFDDNGQDTGHKCPFGCTTPFAAVDWWMNISPPHRAVLLDPNLKDIGAAAMGEVADPAGSSSGQKGLYVVDFGTCP